MAKRPVQFRLEEDMIAKLDWLAEYFGCSRTDVVRLAIVRLYEEKRAEEVVKLVPTPSGEWILEGGGEEIFRCKEELISRLPEGLRRKLEEGMPRGDAWPTLLLSLAAVAEEEKLGYLKI